MTKDRMKIFCAGMMLCFATVGLTACGSSDDATGETVNGRLTSASDTQIVVEVFDNVEAVSGGGARGEGRGDGEMPDGVSGGAAKGERGQKPDGDVDEAMGTPPADGDGTDSYDAKKGKSGETKTYTIDSDTVIYQSSGDDKTEITIDDVDLGSMLEIVVDGDVAKSITVQDTSSFSGGGGRGDMGRQGSSGGADSGEENQAS